MFNVFMNPLSVHVSLMCSRCVHETLMCSCVFMVSVNVFTCVHVNLMCSGQPDVFTCVHDVFRTARCVHVC